MPSRPDVIIYDRDGKSAAAIEIKKKSGTGQEWASRLRRNILAHSTGWSARFFVIATPDRLYIWDQESASEPDDPPSSVLDARPLLAPFFERAGLEPEETAGHAFELVVGEFLSDLLVPEALEDAVKSVLDPHLLQAVQYGRVGHQVAA
jgi:hypothetical protein